MTLLLLIFCLIAVCGKSTNITNTVFQTWVTDPRYSLFPSLPIAVPQSKNELCRSHSHLLVSGLNSKSLWAMKMWDSSAKAPVGIFSGNIYHLGNFDECLMIVAPFEVKFCVVEVFANISSKYLDFQYLMQTSSVNAWTYIAKSVKDSTKVPRNVLQWGLCLPATCLNSEIQEAITLHLEAYNMNFSNQTNFKVRIREEFCTQHNEKNKFLTGEIVFWGFFTILILLTASSTVMDFISKNSIEKQSKYFGFWMLFSMKQNYSQVFPTGARVKNHLDVFHGIKFLSILFILYGHRVGISLSLSAINFNEVEDNLINDQKMFFVHTDLVVDTFFFISGLLASYILTDIYSQKFVNPVYVILVRISRLAPLYFFVVWYQSTAALRTGSGPLWNSLAKNETKFCQDNWWANILFISNYIKTDDMCLQHSWFLPCELHFFTLATILLPILLKNHKIGYAVMLLIIAVSSIIPSITIYVNKIQPMILFYYDFLSQPRKNKSFNLLYIKSHNRATVYLIGTMTGFFLYRNKDTKKKLSKISELCGYLVWMGFMFTPMAYGSLYYDSTRAYNPLEAAIFGSLRRIFWALGFTAFALCHRFGTLKIFDNLWSTKVSIFLSRITYGIYLWHFNFIVSDVLSQRSPRFFSINNVITEGLGDLLKAGTTTLIMIFILEIPLKRFLREIIFVNQIENFEKQIKNKDLFSVRL